MDLSTLSFSDVSLYLLTGVVALVAHRFPLVGPVLQKGLDFIFRKPTPTPTPTPTPAPVPTPTPGPEPLPSPAPSPTPVPELTHPILDSLLSMLRGFLENRFRTQTYDQMKPEEFEALVAVRKYCDSKKPTDPVK
jgi:hypothetical protein